MTTSTLPKDIQDLLASHGQWLDRTRDDWYSMDQLYEKQLRTVVDNHLGDDDSRNALILSKLILSNIDFTIKEGFTLGSQVGLIDHFFVIAANNNIIEEVSQNRDCANTVACIAIFKLACFEEDSASLKFKKLKKKDIAVPSTLYETLTQWSGKHVDARNTKTTESVVELLYGPAIWDLITPERTSLIDVPTHIWRLQLPVAFMPSPRKVEASIIPQDLL